MTATTTAATTASSPTSEARSNNILRDSARGNRPINKRKSENEADRPKGKNCVTSSYLTIQQFQLDLDDDDDDEITIKVAHWHIEYSRCIGPTIAQHKRAPSTINNLLQETSR